VYFGGVLENDEFGEIVEGDAQLLTARPAIRQQSRLEVRIRPARATTLAPRAGLRESSTSI
jgi:hypothetical protein